MAYICQLFTSNVTTIEMNEHFLLFSPLLGSGQLTLASLVLVTVTELSHPVVCLLNYFITLINQGLASCSKPLPQMVINDVYLKGETETKSITQFTPI